MRHSCWGKLEYDPKHKNTRFAPWWLILKCPQNIVSYYQHWLLWDQQIKVKGSLWGSHVSVISGTKPLNIKQWRARSKRHIQIEYNPILKTNGLYWWLKVYSTDLEMIRKELGLKPRPNRAFHLTIGKELKSAL